MSRTIFYVRFIGLIQAEYVQKQICNCFNVSFNPASNIVGFSNLAIF